jgi:hypothetical protein
MNKTATYKYIGEDKFFIKNGQVIKGNITTWSIKKPFNNERETVEVLYVPNTGFNGEDIPINKQDLIELTFKSE